MDYRGWIALAVSLAVLIAGGGIAWGQLDGRVESNKTHIELLHAKIDKLADDTKEDFQRVLDKLDALR